MTGMTGMTGMAGMTGRMSGMSGVQSIDLAKFYKVDSCWHPATFSLPKDCCHPNTMPRRSIREKPDREKKPNNRGIVWKRSDADNAPDMPFDFVPLLRPKACIASLWHHGQAMCQKSLDRVYQVDSPCRSVKGTVDLNIDLWHHLWYNGPYWFPCRQHILPPLPNSRRRRITMRWSWDMQQRHDDALWSKLFPSTIQYQYGPVRPDSKRQVLGIMSPISNVTCIYDVVDQELTYRFRYHVGLYEDEEYV